jgi:ubiquinone/menaquinone biosynthesis C-methylase UbiE
VGVDYAAAMLERCRARHPDAELVEADATDLSAFASGSFDVVVFSFNGIDCIHPEAARVRCWTEMRRVLAPGGIAVVAQHNPRAVVRRPRVAPGASVRGRLVALFRAASESLRAARQLVPTAAFWRGSGYYADRAHGRNLWHAATPRRAVDEANAAGFTRVGEIVGVDHPRPSRSWSTGWFIYTFQATDIPSA